MWGVNEGGRLRRAARLKRPPLVQHYREGVPGAFSSRPPGHPMFIFAVRPRRPSGSGPAPHTAAVSAGSPQEGSPRRDELGSPKFEPELPSPGAPSLSSRSLSPGLRPRSRASRGANRDRRRGWSAKRFNTHARHSPPESPLTHVGEFM